jgi:hypothetical protein
MPLARQCRSAPDNRSSPPPTRYLTTSAEPSTRSILTQVVSTARSHRCDSADRCHPTYRQAVSVSAPLWSTPYRLVAADRHPALLDQFPDTGVAALASARSATVRRRVLPHPVDNLLSTVADVASEVVELDA